MKKLMSAILAAALILGGAMISAPAASADENNTVEHRWRHRSPATAGLIINPIAVTAFLVDAPIYVLVREQPLTAGLAELELIDGYNPVTGEKSGAQYDSHTVDITENY